MEITPKKENPEKPLENVGNYAAPHLSKPASLLNNDKTYNKPVKKGLPKINCRNLS